ncbi:alginate export family protein [Capnocytophaga ochracea]|nr:alginate export family protein [Capnocytophaga ochracea]EJF43805.1 hypothetical protein HMPREF1319_0767 [Capnocytophaga ochracea str. Holt 25]UEB42695.1 alginate export family protein [Capnocytophaga ochracea]
MKKHLLSFFALGTAFVLYPTLATAQVENPPALNEGVPPPQPPMEEMMTPPPPPPADNEFTLLAQIRPRFEYRNGAYRPLVEGESPAILTNNRVRLNFDYKHSDRLHLYVSLQNVNVWGQAQQIQAVDRTGGMSVFEAYAEFPLINTLSAKVGRQVIALDDDRIFGSLDWHPAGRSHDAVNLNWTPSEKWTLRGFFAYNQSGSTVTPTLNVNTPSGQNFTPKLGQDYQHLQALHAHYSISEAHQLSLLFANLGYRTNDSTDQNMQTFGAHYTGKSNQLTYGASAYMQTGKNAVGADKSAYMFAVNAGYKFSPIFGLTAGIDYLSGNASDDTSGKDKVFNPFSGTNHKFYGFMDYYYVGAPGSNAAPSAGLLNPYLSANVRTGEKSNLSATFHYFAPAAKFEDGGKKHSSYGSEIDLVYNLKVQPFIGLQVGYSTYFANDGTKALKGTANQRGYQDWFWCSLNINPKLFSAIF